MASRSLLTLTILVKLLLGALGEGIGCGTTNSLGREKVIWEGWFAYFDNKQLWLYGNTK